MIAAIERSRDNWWSPLRHRTYRDLWVWNCASSLGSIVQSVGAAWMMTSFQPSATMVTLVSAAVTAPPILLSLPAGTLADHVDRRSIMLAAQLGMFVASAVLAGLAFAGLMNPVLLLLFTFLIGCGQAVNTPAWMASMSQLVPRRDLPSAIMLNSVGYNMSRVTGPAMGGLILAVAGASTTFAVNAFSYVGEIIVLFRWRRSNRDLRIDRGPSADRGYGSVARSKEIRRLALAAAAFGCIAIALPSLLPVLIKALPNADVTTYGFTLAVFGSGAIVAGLSGHRMREHLGSDGLLRLSVALTGTALLCVSVHCAIWTIAPAVALSGAGWVWAYSTLTTGTQLAATPGQQGRALALYQLAAFSGMTLGSVVWGITVDLVGKPLALASAVLLSVIVLIGIWAVRSR